MARVLLLNPPARGRPKLRDFACGESTKADYYWAPIDLLVLSGLLSRVHDVVVLDAVAEGLGEAEALERAAAARPEAVFSLTAAVTLAEDDAFLGRLRERAPGVRVYGLGDVASYAPEAGLAAARSFDGMVQNFGDPSLLALAGGVPRAELSSVVLRQGAGARTYPLVRQEPLRYPIPLHERFPLHRYRLPFTRWRRSTSVLTAYGCPFPCTFCASGGLPFQTRPIADVMDELGHVQDLGVPEVYVRDFTFGPSRRRARELVEAMLAAGLRLSWTAECRLDVLDQALLERMRRAGCEVILVGLESGSSDVMARLGKRATPGRTRELLRAARACGLRVCGHFVMGTPGETRADLLATARYARSLPLDYASFNLYAPRLGSEMRAELERRGLVEPGDLGHPDVSLRADAWADVSPAELARLFRWAVLSFYLRPGQAARLARRTPWSTLTRQAVGVLRLLGEMES